LEAESLVQKNQSALIQFINSAADYGFNVELLFGNSNWVMPSQHDYVLSLLDFSLQVAANLTVTNGTTTTGSTTSGSTTSGSTTSGSTTSGSTTGGSTAGGSTTGGSTTGTPLDPTALIVDPIFGSDSGSGPFKTIKGGKLLNI
jgi:hypothetical protein